MKVTETKLQGCVIIDPDVHEDSRGYFLETWSEREFTEKVGNCCFVQDNQSKSSYGVIRGLHFQKPPYAQAKLVRCVQGRVLDVAVDIRKGSPTYGEYVAVELSGDNHRQLFVPRGFAHGFSVLSESAIFVYRVDNVYNASTELGISPLSSSLSIDWRLFSNSDAILSPKDLQHPDFKDFESPFDYKTYQYRKDAGYIIHDAGYIIHDAGCKSHDVECIIHKDGKVELID